MPVEPRELDLATLAFAAGSAAQRALLSRIRREGHPQLRIAHGYVFQHLIERAPTIGELAAALEVTQQAASKSARELEQLGYVTRTRDALDGRVTRLALTARGQDAVAVARRARTELERELQARLESRDMGTARAALATLLALVDGDAAVRGRAIPFPSDAAPARTDDEPQR